MSDWAELLTELRDLTATLVRDARSGNASADDIRRRVEERQPLFDRLNALEVPVPKEHEHIVHELIKLDRTLSQWCEETQRKIGAGLVKRRRTPAVYSDNPARIIIQSA